VRPREVFTVDLAKMYRNGLGCETSDIEALKWLEKYEIETRGKPENVEALEFLLEMNQRGDGEVSRFVETYLMNRDDLDQEECAQEDAEGISVEKEPTILSFLKPWRWRFCWIIMILGYDDSVLWCACILAACLVCFIL
jgi:hypothetical protein